ncbi:glycosyltransferase [Vibrio cionasavignyae]|uniref:glycosyltransferase n=1 Tax=Vibrio cionasavignyae TaxID=2910252 RepID=UPI003D0A4760
MPKISVILPVYNGEKYLSQAIESVLSQSFCDFELIVLNDGSTDKTQDIIDSYCGDSRLKPVAHDNIGLVKTLNKGLELAKGKLVARMDADDICHAERFEVQYMKFSSDYSLSVLGSAIQLIDEDDERIRCVDYPRTEGIDSFIRKGSPVAHPAVMMKLEDIRSIGGYREAFDCAEDYDLWFRLHDAGYKIDNCPQVLMDYRQTQSGISFSQSSKQAVVTRLVKMAHDMRITEGKDSFDSTTTTSIDSLKIGLGKYIGIVEFARYELIWFKTYNISFEHMEDVNSRFNRCCKSLRPESKSLFLLKRSTVYFNSGYYTKFFLDFIRSFCFSPKMFFLQLKNRL